MGRDDYGFYGEDDGAVAQEIKGITGDVTNYTYTGVSYPCVIFKEGFKCPKHKMTVISHMVKPPTRHKGLDINKPREAVEDTSVGLYFAQKGELFKMGALNGLQIGAFLDLVGTDSVKGFYDESTPLTDDHLYALCTV